MREQDVILFKKGDTYGAIIQRLLEAQYMVTQNINEPININNVYNVFLTLIFTFNPNLMLFFIQITHFLLSIWKNI